jgi:hypothetical protein
MKSKLAYSRKDLLCFLACVAFLLLNIGAIGAGGRKRAKEMVCLSNLRQWGDIFQAFTNDNNGYFYSGASPLGHWWIADLEDQYQSYKKNPLWFCPTAKNPIRDEHGITRLTFGTFGAWGIYTRSDHGSLCADGVAGSYGLNACVLNVPPGATSGWYRTENSWRTPHVQGAANIPVFLDSRRFDSWPSHTDQPPQYEAQYPLGIGRISDFCFNRHNGAVSCLFMDWSVRKVGLKQLWTFKWHRGFHTEGPWTRAGGVTQYDWPEWMRELREY